GLLFPFEILRSKLVVLRESLEVARLLFRFPYELRRLLPLRLDPRALRSRLVRGHRGLAEEVGELVLVALRVAAQVQGLRPILFRERAVTARSVLGGPGRGRRRLPEGGARGSRHCEEEEGAQNEPRFRMRQRAVHDS